MAKLKVWDIIIGEQYGRYTKYVIERVTSKMAMSWNTRFWSDYGEQGYDNGWIRAVGGHEGGAWSGPAYRVILEWGKNTHLLSKYNVQSMANKITKIDLKTLWEDKLQEIIAIIERA